MTIRLPDELRELLANRANENGFDTVEQYAEALLRADAESDLLPEDVEEEILRRLNDPTPPIDAETFKANLFRRIRERRDQK